MANRQRGEVAFVVGEGEAARTYILKYGTNEFVQLEEALGMKGGMMLLGLAKNVGFKELRTIIRVGLSRHAPDMTDAQAGDLIDDLGGLTRVPELINEAISAAMPDKPKEAVGKAKSLASPSPGNAF